MHKTFTLASGFLLLSLIYVWWQDTRQPQPLELIPALTGQAEYCTTCHTDLPEISPSHPVESFGCVLCHGGERLALDADLAHSSMRGGGNPSDLAVVEQSCGGADCHSGSAELDRDHIQRVMTSIQSTYAGAIGSVRYTFGAQPDLQAYFGIEAVSDEQSKSGITALAPFDPAAGTNPSILKFGENCLTCHLLAPPREGLAYERLTGCAACHAPLSPPHLPIGEGQRARAQAHSLTIAIPFAQCNTCHNRGNYDLRTMTFVDRADNPVKRIDLYYQPIAQFTQCEYTLDCVDCHTRSEAMGDGDIHAKQKDIQYVRCSTCHGTPTELPRTRTLTDPEDISFRLAALNPVVELELGDTILVTEKGEPLWNTRALPDGSYEMTGKATRQLFVFRPVLGSGCTQSGNDQSSAYCHQCHAIER
jgi:hypothetical protein